MKLIALKPCSFGGKQFYINDEIPADLVLNPIQQAEWGVLTMKDEPAAPAVAAEKSPVKKTADKKAAKKPAEEAGEQ